MPLYIPGDQYALKMRLVDHVYDDQVIDEMTVKIIMPEGARSVQTHLKYLLWGVFTGLDIYFPFYIFVLSSQKHSCGYTLQNQPHAEPAALYIPGHFWAASAGGHQEQPGGAAHSGFRGKMHRRRRQKSIHGVSGLRLFRSEVVFSL